MIDRERAAGFGPTSLDWQAAGIVCARDITRIDPQGTAPTLWRLVDWCLAFAAHLAGEEREMSGDLNQ